MNNYPEFPYHPAITVLPFHEAHLMSLNVTNESSQVLSKFVPVQQMIKAQADLGRAFTVILHGKPAAVVGSVKLWNGVEEMWLHVEERMRNFPVYMTKAAIEYIDFTVIAGNLHRLQITVRCADMRAVRWARCIGFTIDGMMMRYGPDGSDYYLMSRS
jgi:RimJ/RimL family protein N-acetyltransferase